MLRHFSAILTEKVLFEEYFSVVEASGFDVDVAASRVLGHKMARLAAEDTRAYVHSLLARELKQGTDSKLVRELGEHLLGAGEERSLQLLGNL